jgi:hypothetical protein
MVECALTCAFAHLPPSPESHAIIGDGRPKHEACAGFWSHSPRRPAAPKSLN